MKNYKLVPMDRSHIPAIAQIERECFSAPWSEAMLEEELYNPLASFIVAQRPDGAVLGYAGLHVVMDEGYIDNLAVREDYRGNGIGDDLLDVFVRFGREHLAFLTLEVRLLSSFIISTVLPRWAGERIIIKCQKRTLSL